MPNVRQVKLFPAMDNAAEARALLEEHVKNNPLIGRTNLAQLIVGQLPAFVLTSIFEDIGALEKNRDSLWADSTFLDFQSKLNPLQAAHRNNDLRNDCQDCRWILVNSALCTSGAVFPEQWGDR